MAELHFSKRHGKTRDISGETFGRLTAIGVVSSKPVKWLCICECGSETVVAPYKVIHGTTKSCGCWLRENSANLLRTHGLSSHPMHTIWLSIIQRCDNPNHARYARYGGRGILLCDAWRHFPDFLKDMGERPSKKHSIERRDNDGNYCPENCSWELPIVQARNSSHNKLITFNDKTQCVSEWAEEIRMEYGTLARRLNALNWPIERALTEPVRSKRKH